MSSSRKTVCFIDAKNIEVSRVMLADTNSTLREESIAYTGETFGSLLEGVLSGEKGARFILAEELVYVTTLFFSLGTVLNREGVRTKAEQSIPEDLRATAWDFRTLQCIEHQKDERLCVQVAVMTHDFSQLLQPLLETSSVVEAVLPESYVLATLEAEEEGLTVVVRQEREFVLFVATKQGAVLHTLVRPGTQNDFSVLENFLRFTEERTGEKIARVVASQWTNSFRTNIEARGQRYEEKSHDLFQGVFSEGSSGADSSVLNLNTFLHTRPAWWRNLFQKKA